MLRLTVTDAFLDELFQLKPSERPEPPSQKIAARFKEACLALDFPLAEALWPEAQKRMQERSLSEALRLLCLEEPEARREHLQLGGFTAAADAIPSVAMSELRFHSRQWMTRLIGAGADADFKYGQRLRAPFLAALRLHPQALALLLESGSTALRKPDENQSPLGALCARLFPEPQIPTLELSEIDQDRAFACAQVLLESGADPDDSAAHAQSPVSLCLAAKKKKWPDGRRRLADQLLILFAKEQKALSLRFMRKPLSQSIAESIEETDALTVTPLS